MFKFIKNLFKVITKPKIEDNVIPFVPKEVQLKKELSKDRNIKWIKNDVGIERTKKGIIVHSIDSDLSPGEIINLVSKMIKDGEI